MIRWFFSFFAWRLVRDQGVWGYYENAVTGERRAVRLWSSGYSPLDIDWLERRPARASRPPLPRVSK